MSSNIPTFMRFNDEGTKLVKFNLDFVNEGDYIGYVSAANGASIPVLTQANNVQIGPSPGGLYLANTTSNTTIKVPTASQIAAGYVLFANGSWGIPTANGATVVAGGPNQAIQFNDSTSFAGNSNFTYNSATGVLTIGGGTLTGTSYSGTAANASALNGVAASGYLLVAASTFGGTASNASALGGIAANQYLLANATAVAALSANNSQYLGGTLYTGYLLTTAPTFDGQASTANNSAYLGGVAASGYLLVGGTALTSNNASYLGGIIATSYLLANAATFAGQSATSNSALFANNASYLGGVIATQYAYANATAPASLVANNSLYLGGIAANQYAYANAISTTANNSLYLGSIIATQYAYANTVLPVANLTQAISGAGNNAVITPWSVAQAITALGASAIWITKSSAYTIVPGDQIIANTSLGSFTLTLPASPAVGAHVIVVDGSNTWGSNNLTIAASNSTINIMGSNTAFVCDVAGSTVELLYTDPTRGWVLERPAIAVTGVYIPPTFQKFLSVGTFTYTPTSPDVKRIRIRMLGGGSGGAGSGSTGYSPGFSSAGGDTKFGIVLTAGGAAGAGNAGAGSTGGSGGVPTVSAGIYAFTRIGGGGGSVGNGSSAGPSGAGHGGVGGYVGIGGGSAQPNSGGGGGGAGSSGSTGYNGSGGGEGAEIDAWINGPLANSYTVIVGAGSVGGAAGPSGFAGGAGGSGGIWIEEYYDAISAPIAQGSLRYDIFQNLSSDQQASTRASLGITKKNYLVNGGCQISQENGGAASSAGSYYPVDQFVSAFSAGTATVGQINSVTPSGSANRIRITVTAAKTSTTTSDYYTIFQCIEGQRMADLKWGTSAAKTVTLQFGVKAPAGTYCVSFLRVDETRVFIAEYVISAGEANTDVIKSITIPGDVTGPWNKDSQTAMRLRWTLMIGTTYVQTAGAWGTTSSAFASPNQTNMFATNGNVFELFDVGLYEGSTAPAFKLQTYQDDFLECLRYFLFETYDGGEFWLHPIDLTSPYRRGNYRFRVPMRVAPTLTITAITNGTFSGAPVGGAATINGCNITGDLTGGGYTYVNSLKATARM
jgi:hypothetical protein